MYDHGLTAMFSILSNICTVTEALEAGQENLISASENIARLIRILVYAINMMAYFVYKMRLTVRNQNVILQLLAS